MTVHPRPTRTEFGRALATYSLAMTPGCGTLVCGSRLVFPSCPSFRVDLLDGLFPVLPSLFSVLDETCDHYTDACRYLSFHPATTPLQRTCMHTTYLLVSLGPLVVTSYCLILPFLPFPFLCLVFSSILGDYTCVWVCLCPFPSCFFPFLFPTTDVSTRSR